MPAYNKDNIIEVKNSHQLLCCWLASERNTIPLFSLCVVICVVVWCIALWMNSGVIVTKKEYLYFFISKGKNIYYYYAIVIIIIRIVSSVNDFGTRILTKKNCDWTQKWWWTTEQCWAWAVTEENCKDDDMVVVRSSLLTTSFVIPIVAPLCLHFSSYLLRFCWQATRWWWRWRVHPWRELIIPIRIPLLAVAPQRTHKHLHHQRLLLHFLVITKRRHNKLPMSIIITVQALRCLLAPLPLWPRLVTVLRDWLCQSMIRSLCCPSLQYRHRQQQPHQLLPHHPQLTVISHSSSMNVKLSWNNWR